MAGRGTDHDVHPVTAPAGEAEDTWLFALSWLNGARMSVRPPLAHARAWVFAALAGGLVACSSESLGPNPVAITIAGQGRVTSTPPGINCPSQSCRYDFTAAELA